MTLSLSGLSLLEAAHHEKRSPYGPLWLSFRLFIFLSISRVHAHMMYVCNMYVCLHNERNERMFVCMYVSMYLCIHASMPQCSDVFMCLCAFVSMHRCIYASMYLCVYLCMCLCVHVPIDLSICLYLSIYLSNLSIYLRLSVRPSGCLSVCESVSL